ncbi:regulatory signaling modulator protein AmpE [Shigella flexneri]
MRRRIIVYSPASCGASCTGLGAGSSAGVADALIGHGAEALPALFCSAGDSHTSQYQVLTRLAQFSRA